MSKLGGPPVNGWVKQGLALVESHQVFFWGRRTLGESEGLDGRNEEGPFPALGSCPSQFKEHGRKYCPCKEAPRRIGALNRVPGGTNRLGTQQIKLLNESKAVNICSCSTGCVLCEVFKKKQNKKVV